MGPARSWHAPPAVGLELGALPPNATLAGGASLGELSQLGAGACVLPRVRVGRNCIVGAGAVVTRDVPDNCVCMGVPARVTRQLDR